MIVLPYVVERVAGSFTALELVDAVDVVDVLTVADFVNVDGAVVIGLDVA